MDAPKWAQKVSDCCPHAFNRIDVDFSNTISIVISCPLPLTMTYYRMGGGQSGYTLAIHLYIW